MRSKKTKIKSKTKIFSLSGNSESQILNSKFYVNSFFSFVYKYINYEIIEVIGSEVKILCCRRYNHFYKLDKFIRRKYQNFLVPLLPQKNFYTIIGNVDKEFLNKRKSKLSIYLNFLYKHSFFGNNCKEFSKFLYNNDFDSRLFEFKPEDELHPETLKATKEDLKDVVSNNFNSIYNYFFK